MGHGGNGRSAIEGFRCQRPFDGVMEQDHVARAGPPHDGADTLGCRPRLPVKRINGPQPRSEPNGSDGDGAGSVQIAFGRPEEAHSAARRLLYRRPSGSVVGDQSRERHGPWVRMGRGMRPYAVAIGQHAPHQVRMLTGPLTGQEEGGRHLQAAEHIEEVGRERRIRPIVKGERHSPGRRIKAAVRPCQAGDRRPTGCPQSGFPGPAPLSGDAEAIHGLRPYPTRGRSLPGEGTVSG